MGEVLNLRNNKKNIIIMAVCLVTLFISAFIINNIIISSASNGADISWKFSDSKFSKYGKITATTSIDNLTINASTQKYVNISSCKTTIDKNTYKKCLKLNGMGNASYRSLCFNIENDANVEIVLKSNGKTDRKLIVADEKGNNLSTINATTLGTTATFEYTSYSGKIYLYSENSGINIYKISIYYKGDNVNQVTNSPSVTVNNTKDPIVTSKVTNIPSTITPSAITPSTKTPNTINPSTITPNTNKPSTNTTMSAQEIVSAMKAGWNLGNTLDSTASWISNGTPTQYETAWGNPVTTKAMISAIKNAGFNTVRVPVSWGEKMGASPDYTINSAWLDRVQEVVDYCIDNDMYVIINVHHDGSWLYPDNSHKVSASAQLKKLWTQVANRFKEYDQHLVFETMNEPRLEGTSYEWTSGTSEAWSVINYYNDTAVDAIRSVGGNNLNRAIMIPTYAASPSADAINALEVPNNDSMIILSVHGYSPYYFSMVVGETSSWGSNSDKADIDSLINTIYSCANSKGLPVVIGEFGTINKNNIDARTSHASYYTNAANSKGITCIWWDNGCADANVSESYSIFDRGNLSIRFQSIVDALVR